MKSPAGLRVIRYSLIQVPYTSVPTRSDPLVHQEYSRRAYQTAYHHDGCRTSTTQPKPCHPLLPNGATLSESLGWRGRCQTNSYGHSQFPRDLSGWSG
jgi:hypothetical protein